MSEVSFTRREKELLSAKLQRYFADELKIELGGFDAEFLLDYVSKELGAYYYNQGLRDAQAVFLKRVGELTDLAAELEKPTEFVR